MKIPPSVEELMKIFSKEVIRSQPADIVEFISTILDQMVEIKKGNLEPGNLTEPWVKEFTDNLLPNLNSAGDA